MERIDIAKKLERQRAKAGDAFLTAVKGWIDEESRKRTTVSERLATTTSTPNQFDFDLLETGRIYHIDQIREICVTYRLRFLPSRFFKEAYPAEAITAIRELERTHETELSQFHVMAPSKMFLLKKREDPLLFTSLGNDYYYLVHKWGTDLHPLRKLMVWPMRNFLRLLGFLLVVSILLTALIPETFHVGASPEIINFVSFLFIFKGVCGIAIYYCFWKGKNFNEVIWDSEFSN